nr:unnamed protein product [Digitaria exilis]
MEKAAGKDEDETVEERDKASKRKRAATDGAPSGPTAGFPEFRSLHCRLAPPLPRPHVAYLATAPIRRRPQQEEPSSTFLGFHVAGAGVSGGTTNPTHSLAGRRYADLVYVNTCNGVVLLAGEDYSASCRCVLWNPAVADVVEEVTVSYPNRKDREYLVLGPGYGQRSKTYKLLWRQIFVCKLPAR